MLLSSIAHKTVKKLRGSIVTETQDDIAVEEPLEIILKHGRKNSEIQQVVSITMRTPGNDEELALGFLFTEAIIHQHSQVYETYAGDDNKVVVTLNEDVLPALHKADRNFYTTSSCGVCGKTSIESISVVSKYRQLTDNIFIQPSVLHQLGTVLQKEQALFQKTGGLHAAALFDFQGNFDCLREDVGRHNALDKVIGAAFLGNELPLNTRILFLSGRASFELIQKAVMAGIKVVAAVGAPSSLAIEMAQDSKITLVGFVRHNSFNVYTGDHRIVL
jgi:FdhD protein